MRKKSVSVIFLTVLVDLVGFGLILPLIPIYGKQFHAVGWQIGAIVSSYSLMQFIFAPIWGRVSDRVGRRPILLTSTACACVSYVILAIGSGLKNSSAALILLLVSRAFAGICGANITVAQAYLADITPPEKRSSRMGIVGMAFGLGFIFGPILGIAGTKLIGITGPGWTAAGLCAINFIVAYIRLGESWQPAEHSIVQRPHLDQWLHTLRTPRLNLLVAIFFLATFCFTCFEVTISWLIMRNFGIDAEKSMTEVLMLIAYCGVVGASVQSPGTIARMVKRIGEPKLIATSLFLAAVGICLLPFLRTWGLLLVGLGIFAIGSSLTRPPVFGLISIMTPPTEQGATMGVTQGVGSLARIVGPMFAGALFDVNMFLPYVICAALCLATSLLTVTCLTHIPHPATPVPTAEQSPH